MSEVAGKGHRGFYSSFQYVTLIGGQLLALLVLMVLQLALSPEDLRAWGWRIPFVIGALAAIVAMYLRRSLEETASAESDAPQGGGLARRACCSHKRAVHARACLHHGRVALFLHLHDLHAEIPRQHRAYGSEDGEHRHDRRARALHVHAAGLRRALRSDRPQEQHDCLRRAGGARLGAYPLRRRKRRKRDCGLRLCPRRSRRSPPSTPRSAAW